MAQMTPETKAKVKAAFRHPVAWWRGASLPEEELRPWERGIHFLANGLQGLMGGFGGMRGLMYDGLGEGKIPPNWQSVAAVPRIIWDAVNDVIIGNAMDRKRPGVKFLRWILRINATLSPIFTWILLLNMGLSPLQRIIVWTAFDMVWDVMSTAAGICGSKIWNGITPHTGQRNILQHWSGMGSQLGEALSSFPLLAMGLKDIFGWTDYQIMVYGSAMFVPLTIFCRWLPTFAKQRVDFQVKVKGEAQAEEDVERQPTFKESFTVVKHNKWWMMWTILGFLTLIIPGGSNQLFLYRFLMPKTKFGEHEVGGEMFFFIKNFVFGGPPTLLTPLAVRVVGLFKDRLNYMRISRAVSVVTNLLPYFVGYKSMPRLLFMFTCELIRECFRMWDRVPGGVIGVQMLDYVEWKTGQRSEGMTAAVDGFLNKLIKSNMSNFIGNAWRTWTQFQGWDVPKEQQPARFLNTIWPLMHLPAVAHAVIGLGALLWFKYPHDPKAVEADLVERRALAQKMKEEAQAAI